MKITQQARNDMALKRAKDEEISRALSRDSSYTQKDERARNDALELLNGLLKHNLYEI